MTNPQKDAAPTDHPARHPAQRRAGLPEGLAGVANIIAVGSGKGGVGKSTVAANLAAALQARGARVGLMDADIYGPSQPGLLGAPKARAEMASEDFLAPLVRHGLRFISIGLLMDNDGPVVWRAPMAMKMVQQFLANVAWGELDYLLIDMPPGTGDVQLTLAQQAPLTGSIVVTTPQQVALGIARKGLKMFQQVNVPILGVVENMSGFLCRKCGEANAIFRQGGGDRLARESGVPFLGAVPLDPDVVESGEAGAPIASSSPESAAARAFFEIARRFEDEVDRANRAAGSEPEKASLDEQGRLVIHWPGGHRGLHTPYQLRVACSCAACVDENTGERTLDPKRVPLDIRVENLRPVGRYGLAVLFSDGHDTGIYTFDRLKSLCECEDCRKKKPAPESFAV